jgi:hypothetical protein
VVNLTCKQNVHGAIAVAMASRFHFLVVITTKLNAPRVSIAKRENRSPRIVALIPKQSAPIVPLVVKLEPNGCQRHAVKHPILNVQIAKNVQTMRKHLQNADLTTKEIALCAQHVPTGSGNLVHAELTIKLTALIALRVILENGCPKSASPRSALNCRWVPKRNVLSAIRVQWESGYPYTVASTTRPCARNAPVVLTGNTLVANVVQTRRPDVPPANLVPKVSGYHANVVSTARQNVPHAALVPQENTTHVGAVKLTK